MIYLYTCTFAYGCTYIPSKNILIMVWALPWCVCLLWQILVLLSLPPYTQIILQEQLPTDLARVDMLFQKARDAGINIEVLPIQLRIFSIKNFSKSTIVSVLLASSTYVKLIDSSYCCENMLCLILYLRVIFEVAINVKIILCLIFLKICSFDLFHSKFCNSVREVKCIPSFLTVQVN